MPIIKSAKKRVKTARKAAARNSKTKRKLREAVKDFNSALASGSKPAIEKAHIEVVRALDIAVKRAIIHKNKAARKKSQLSASAKKAGAKSPVKAKTVKTTPPKKPSKAPVAKKKPAAKKLAPKK